MQKQKKSKVSTDNAILNERCRIMIVDDDALVLTALNLTLKNEGYEVKTAKSGEQAIRMVKRFNPAVIICDQEMPGMSGIETLGRIQEILPDTIRILLTGNTALETAIEAINVGHVSHYITKPWNNDKLQKTIHAAIEKYKLTRENQILQELIFTQHTKLSKAHNSLLQELKLGARIQERLLFGKIPKNFKCANIEALSYPSKSIDGDFIEFYEQTPQVLDIVFGDVMGKGLAAALVGIAVKTQLIRFAHPSFYTQIYTKVAGWISPPLNPDAIISNVHKEIVSQLIDLEHFVTLFYGRLNCVNKTFSFIDCGSTKPLHFDNKTGRISFLSGDNVPLGVDATSTYELEKIDIDEGDLLVFYSDGITEARSPDGEFFGTKRLATLVEENHDLPSKRLLDLVKETIFAFTEKQHLDDDLTLIVLKLNQFASDNSIKQMSAEFDANISQLPSVRDFVRQVCKMGNGDLSTLVEEFELAIDEVFSNIVQHGRLEDKKNRIFVEGEIVEEGVWIKLSDQGVSFDPTKIKEPSFLGDRTSGFGWHMIKEISDLVCYTKKQNEDGWNHLSIFKRYHLENAK